ncbi:alpha/beta-hydrolase [Mycena vitilis]|nr:alpha/beta-hydrolase [Mycena vitilis]
MAETHLPTPEPLEKLALSADKTGFVWVELRPELVVGEILRFAGLNGVGPARVGGFWYGSKDGPVGQRASADEQIIYYLHGGGFVMGSGGPSFPPTAVTVKGFLEYLPQIARVFALEYRLATGPPFQSSNPFPAGLIDVVAGYHYLVHEVGFPPQNIIVAGDSSAGGILAYQLARYLATSNIATLSQAGGLLLLSPSADSALRAPAGNSMQTNARSDYIRTWVEAGYVLPALLGALPKEELDRSWLSPGSPVLEDVDTAGLFVGFPPTLILAGEAEMSRDAMRTLRDRMRVDMSEDAVTYVEVADAPHDFVGMSIFEPERTVGLKEIAKWATMLK